MKSCLNFLFMAKGRYNYYGKTQNMQICHSLRCKQIDSATADQFTATFRMNFTVAL